MFRSSSNSGTRDFLLDTGTSSLISSYSLVLRFAGYIDLDVHRNARYMVLRPESVMCYVMNQTSPINISHIFLQPFALFLFDFISL